MNQIVELDHQLFHLLNHEWTNSLFDTIMPVITDLHRISWGIGLFCLILFTWVFVKKASALLPLICLVLSIGTSDFLTYRLMKANFQRQRPEAAGLLVDVRGHSHSGPSFPSNHASNMFAAASALSSFYPALTPVYFGIAALIAYSRVYVGAHFPADVLAGALWGTLLGFLIVSGVRRIEPSIRRRWSKNGANSSLGQNSNL